MRPDFWRGRRVFVTGHTGFKGAWLCLLLERLGARVRGYSLPPPTDPALFDMAQAGQGIDTVTGDVRELAPLTAALREFAPEVVLHMAAQSVVLSSYEDPATTYATNVMGTVNLLEAVRRAACRAAVVNVTTDKVYHNRRWVWAYRENDELGGRDPYSNSKACSELVTHAYVASFFPVAERARHGVAVATARAGNVVGGGDYTPHQLVPAVMAAVQAGQAVELRNPAGVRPWQHVLDCLHGYLTLAEHLATSPDAAVGDWNFGPSAEEAFTVAQVAEVLAGHWKVSPAWTRAAGERPPEEPELRLDSAKAARTLGWRCTLAVPEALEWVAQWHRRTSGGESARAVSLAQIGAFLERVA